VSESLDLEMKLNDRALARDFGTWLQTQPSIRDIRASAPKGVDPFITPIVVTAIVSAGALASIVEWLRKRTQCQIVLDARQPASITKTVDCRVRDGRIIVLASDGTRVQVVDVPELFDFNALIHASLTGGSDAIASAALEGGASVAE
jgi:hypothetical protein